MCTHSGVILINLSLKMIFYILNRNKNIMQFYHHLFRLLFIRKSHYALLQLLHNSQKLKCVAITVIEIRTVYN